MDNERAAFEAWMLQKKPQAEFDRASNGEYLVPVMRIEWEAWQARAALEQPYVRIPKEAPDWLMKTITDEILRYDKHFHLARQAAFDIHHSIVRAAKEART